MQIVPTLLETTREDFLSKLSNKELVQLAPHWQIDVLDGTYGGAICFFDAETVHDFLGTSCPKIELDLMTTRPLDVLELWSQEGLPVIRAILHPAALGEEKVESSILYLKEHHPGIQIGLALTLQESIESIHHFVPDIDHIQLMGVPVGASGQSFQSDIVLPKLESVRYHYPHLSLSVDGGANIDSVPDIAAHGGTQACVNSGLWRSQDPLDMYRRLAAY